MEQTLELMRRRHAYFTRLIEENGIRTAREFYDRFYEQFLLTGTELLIDEDSCSIDILYYDYDYENYTITDGFGGGLATVSPEVAFQWCCTNVYADIFEIDSLDEAF